MLLGVLLAFSLVTRLSAAEQKPEDPRDFLLMKLYEASLKAVAQYQTRPTAEQLAAMQAASGTTLAPPSPATSL